MQVQTGCDSTLEEKLGEGLCVPNAEGSLQCFQHDHPNIYEWELDTSEQKDTPLIDPALQLYSW